ncbi:hypothetical protein BDN72DRAFT_801719 [Pluteus cervinus]|uniref:Uncharacterized protein n=1 Tax=Pluteus cervinus TaxID=181527 RepID=A0ACD3AH28_9AGAR|nr:hypothetical protein BDN72DRAFT_801719 [Pluteus cervinus]
MTKRVHFAPTNTVYSPIPATPSPALSNASLPSTDSPGPSTPPLTQAMPTSYPPVEPSVDPDPIPSPIQVHFILAYSPNSDPAVVYDVSLPPTYITDQFPVHVLSEPATNPPLASLIITNSLLQWNIIVNPLSPRSNVVTVMDVLTAVYHELRPCIRLMEYEALTARKLVDAAYYARCGRLADPDARRLEQKKGVKRVDTLKGKTRFLGLAGTLKGPNIWELFVA